MMCFFEKRLSLCLVLVCLPLLFFPKFNLISLDAEETAGLRVDDIVLFFMGILLMFSHTLSQKRIYKIEGWVLLITLFSLISFLSNWLLVSTAVLQTSAKIFYCVRLLEYFLFFYIGALASQHLRVDSIVRAFFFWNLIIMILQKSNIAGGISFEGYSEDVSTRVQGIASFPSEMGLILNLLFCYLIFDPNSLVQFSKRFKSSFSRFLLKKTFTYWLFCLFGIFVVFTGNRISIIALIVCFLLRLKQVYQWGSPVILLLLAMTTGLLLIGITYIVSQSAGVYDRSLDLFSWKNVELFEIVWDRIDLSQNSIGNEVVSSENYDMSWWVRIHKWLFATKSYLSHPECYLQGLGPGFAGAALDGGILRILTEYGLIGSFLFWKLFKSLYRLNPQTKAMMIAFMINMIFFDAYLAYKTMSLLLFMCGHIFASQGSQHVSREMRDRIRTQMSVGPIIT